MVKILVSVIGGHKCISSVKDLAERIGRIIAEEGAVVVTGGLGGTMEAVSRGAKASGGAVVGILPGDNKNAANKFVDIAITTGMGYSRNTLVAGSADIVIALPGEYGTLSEIAFALNGKKPVYGFGTWDIKDVVKLNDPEEIRTIIRNFKA